MLIKQEINRKLLHGIALLMPISIFYLPQIGNISKWFCPIVLFFLLLISILMELLRFQYPAIQFRYFKVFHTLLRKQEERKITGATYIIGGGLICSLVFVNSPHISFMMLTSFILGDGIAAIVGQSIGRITFLGKTLEGSLACFFLCLIFFFLLFPHIPLLLKNYATKIPCSIAIITSLSITFLELIPIKITRSYILNDNLYVPLISGLIFEQLHNIL